MMLTKYDLSPANSIDVRLTATQIRIEAAQLFNRTYIQGRVYQLVAKILGKSNQLLVLTSQPISSHRSASRIVSVPIHQIKGTLGRSADFDAHFHPLREESRSRWISILTATRMSIPLPAVELVQVGDTYYVRDGHHRISVARSLGQAAIDARIMS